MTLTIHTHASADRLFPLLMRYEDNFQFAENYRLTILSMFDVLGIVALFFKDVGLGSIKIFEIFKSF